MWHTGPGSDLALVVVDAEFIDAVAVDDLMIANVQLNTGMNVCVSSAC
jgi:hypothetical protein